MTFGWGNGLLVVKFMSSRKAKHLADNLLNVVTLYYHAGFHIEIVLMDMDFEKLKPYFHALS